MWNGALIPEPGQEHRWYLQWNARGGGLHMSGAYSNFQGTGTRRYLFSGAGYTLYLPAQKAGGANPAVGPTGLCRAHHAPRGR
ncbi:hypothetical protein GCM10009589_12210 [Arthrobacter pascens]